MINFKEYFSGIWDALIILEKSGLLEMDDSGMQVTNRGWFFVRAIAMLFDRYLQTDRNRARFSKII
jgi:oxygen-independent coproporphyrinogen-3 oxidase